MIASVMCLSLCLVLPVSTIIDTQGTSIQADFHHSLNKTGNDLDKLESPSCWSRLPELGDFTQQAKYFVRRVRLSRAQAHRKSELVAGVRQQLSTIWPDFTMTEFGSTVTGLALSTSDIDVLIIIKDSNSTVSKSSDSEYVLQAAEFFRKNNSYSDVPAKTDVFLPILQFVQTKTNQRFEVTFSTPDRHSEIIKYLFRMDHRAIPLMIILRHWLQLNNLYVPYHMPSILWNALVIFYLQQVNILPPVYILQKTAEPNIIDNWNYAFEEPYECLYPSDNHSSLYELLRGFYEYYNGFDFQKYCVSIFAGTPVPRLLFESVETVPDVFQLYKVNVKSNISAPLQIDGPLCVPEAFAHNLLFGRGKPELLAMKNCFQQAVDTFRTRRRCVILSALLTIKS